MAAWEGWYTVLVVFAGFGCLLKDLAGPDIVMLGALALVLAAGVIEISDGLVGFSNKGLLTVAVLFVVAAGISGTGALDYYMGRLLGVPRTTPGAQVRLMLPVAVVSAFLNNTPVVAIMIPILQKWSKRCNVHPQQLFIPLSFASILGGTCTLIGTSTNLVIEGMLRERYGSQYVIKMFDLGVYGVPVMLSGMAYVLIFSPLLLKGGGGGLAESDEEEEGDLAVAAMVPAGAPVVGKSIEAAKLRGLDGLFLSSVQRDDMLLRGVGPEFVIAAGDLLSFTGVVEKLDKVCREHGLVPLTHEVEEHLDERSSQESDGRDHPESVNTWDGAPPADQAAPPAPRARAASHGMAGLKEVRGGGGRAMPTIPSGADLLMLDTDAAPGPRSLEAEDVGMMLGKGSGGMAGLERGGHRRAGSGDNSPTVRRSMDEVRRLGQPRLSGGHTAYDELLQQGFGKGHSHRERRTSDAEDMSPRLKSVSELLADHKTPHGVRDALLARQTVLRAVVKPNSSLIGNTAKNVGFRKRFQAAIIAVKRQGKKVEGKLGQVVFEEGDVVLLQAAKGSPLVLDTPPARGSPTKGGGADAPADASREAVEHELEVLPSESAEEETSGCILSMQVTPGAPLIGKTVEAAGLRGLPDLFLTAIHRDGEDSVTAVGPQEMIREGDVMQFAGDLTGVTTLRRFPGLVPYTEGQMAKLNVKDHERCLVQAVMATRSNLVGKTIKEVRFRTRFDAVVIAVQRAGTRVHAKLGDIELHAGDMLLLDTGRSFMEMHRANPAFALVTEIENSAPPRFEKLLPAMVCTVVMIIMYVVDVLDLLVSALLASGIMLAAGCLTQDQARRSVKWDVITTIAAAFGLSKAMEESGVASAIATNLVDVGTSLGTGNAGILVAVYVATFLLCNIVGNNAAAALMFPVASEAAEQQGIHVLEMSFLLMLAASASFMSPFGYQTNLMVYGPGGYLFKDFLRFGFPMQMWQLVMSVLVVVWKDQWYVFWIGTTLMCVVTFALRVATPAQLVYKAKRLLRFRRSRRQSI